MDRELSSREMDFKIAINSLMTKVRRDLEQLRDQASADKLRAKRDAKMVDLRKERNFFRGEALQLNQLNKKNEAEVTKLKDKLAIATEERDFFLRQLHDEKINTRALTKELNQLKYGKILGLKGASKDEIKALMNEPHDDMKQVKEDLLK